MLGVVERKPRPPRPSRAPARGARLPAVPPRHVDCDLTRAQLSQGKFAGSAFRGCRLEGLRGLEALKGTAVASGDLAELADAFAASLAIDVRDDIE